MRSQSPHVMKTSCWRHAETIIRHGRYAPIGISRSVPEWAPGGIPVFRQLAPSAPLFRYAKTTDDDATLRYETYAERFERELDELSVHQTWDALHAAAAGREPVLLCWCSPDFDPPRRFCHRRIVAEWFLGARGEEVDEIDPALLRADGCPPRWPAEAQRDLFRADRPGCSPLDQPLDQQLAE
ncbi:MAG: hypothetical protein OXG58_01365 [Gemmatimonadetes bacterium]|nr:hypothetical protein [Gemmatimonadota bacterium]